MGFVSPRPPRRSYGYSYSFPSSRVSLIEILIILAIAGIIGSVVWAAIKERNLPSEYRLIRQSRIEDTSWTEVKNISYDGGKTYIPISERHEEYTIYTDNGMYKTPYRSYVSKFSNVPLCLETNAHDTIRGFLPVETCQFKELK